MRKKAHSQKAEPARAKLFRNGRSQAVRLPKAFRMQGDEVSVRRDDPQRKREAWNRFLEPYSVLSFDRATAQEHARPRFLLRHAPIGERDVLVAAIASANKLGVVTNNLAEFSRVPGLKVEDWSQ